jgi:predicted metal-binding protein
MSQNISISIDLKLIDQKKLKRMTRQSGAEAAFLDLIMIATPESPYGEWMVKQRSTKEEVEAKVQTPILGNAKTAVKWEGQ